MPAAFSLVCVCVRMCARVAFSSYVYAFVMFSLSLCVRSFFFRGLYLFFTCTVCVVVSCVCINIIYLVPAVVMHVHCFKILPILTCLTSSKLPSPHSQPHLSTSLLLIPRAHPNPHPRLHPHSHPDLSLTPTLTLTSVPSL